MSREHPEPLLEPSKKCIDLLRTLALDDMWADLDDDTKDVCAMIAFISRDWVRGEAASVLASHGLDADWRRIQAKATEILRDIESGDY